MQILLTVIITIVALAASILSFSLYRKFNWKYKILTSTYQVPIVFLAVFVFIFFNLIFAPWIIDFLHKNFQLPSTYQKASELAWLVFNCAYIFYKALPRKKIGNMVFLALGSNLGDSRRIVLDAMRRLQDFSNLSTLRSSLWQTSPVNCPPDSPKFMNAVVGFVPKKNETPESLIIKLQELEKQFGRSAKKILNEPRPLDLDLITFGTEIRNSPKLILPHPRAHERQFVLQPLNEIAPELILPGQTQTVAQLLAELNNEESCEKVSYAG